MAFFFPWVKSLSQFSEAKGRNSFLRVTPLFYEQGMCRTVASNLLGLPLPPQDKDDVGLSVLSLPEVELLLTR